MTVATDRRTTLQEFWTYDDSTEKRYELEDGVLVERGTEATINTQTVMFLIQTFLTLVTYKHLGMKHHIEVSSRYATARDPDLMIIQWIQWRRSKD